MKTFFNLHFTELKFHFNCIFILYWLFCIILYLYNEQILFLLIKPLIIIKMSNYFIFTNINELILLKIIISSFISLFLIFYIFLLQIWTFNLPGLRKFENYFYLNFLITYTCLSFFYNYIFFKIIVPSILLFFMQFQTNSKLIDIFFEPRIYNFIIILLNFFVLFFFFFNYLCLLIIFLKNIKKKTLIKYRKFLYFKILFLTTFISPPDLFSQLLISFPIIIIFESLLFFKFFD